MKSSADNVSDEELQLKIRKVHNMYLTTSSSEYVHMCIEGISTSVFLKSLLKPVM